MQYTCLNLMKSYAKRGHISMLILIYKQQSFKIGTKHTDGKTYVGIQNIVYKL